MEPTTFPEVNAIYAKDQPQYRQLPMHRDNSEDGRAVCCWKLTWWERLKILQTGLIWHTILTFHQPLQPQLLATYKPRMSKTKGGQDGR